MAEGDILIGRNPVSEAIKAGNRINRICIAQGCDDRAKRIAEEAERAGIAVEFVPAKVLDGMTKYAKHQGVVAEVPEHEYASLEDVYALAESKGEDLFVVVLDGISDPGNIGAIIRSAECAGAHGVIIPKRRAGGVTPVAAKASAGASEYMPCVRVTNIARTLDELKEKGVWIAACDMDGENYSDANLTGPIAIVIGSEGSGIGRLVKEHCDFTVSIPVLGHIDSLNASNAAAVIMYDIVRQRRAKQEK